jgi:hypothetical protein
MGETYESEREVPETDAEALSETIREFIANWSGNRAFLMTRRRDGREIMRPVGSFMEGWTANTITQDLHLKTGHVRNDPITGYLWVEVDGERYGRLDFPRNVWMQGRAELVEDPAEVAAFFERRAAATGRGDAHPHDDGYRRILIRTRPQYVRAEGFYPDEPMRAVILREFPELAAAR